MAQYIIRHRFTDAPLFTVVADSFKKAVEAAVRAGTSLANANLAGQDLRGAQLQGGVFTGADCARVKFDDAVTRGADFTNAILTKATMLNVLAHGMILTAAELTQFQQRTTI